MYRDESVLSTAPSVLPTRLWSSCSQMEEYERITVSGYYPIQLDNNVYTTYCVSTVLWKNDYDPPV